MKEKVKRSSKKKVGREMGFFFVLQNSPSMRCTSSECVLFTEDDSLEEHLGKVDLRNGVRLLMSVVVDDDVMAMRMRMAYIVIQ